MGGAVMRRETEIMSRGNRHTRALEAQRRRSTRIDFLKRRLRVAQPVEG